MPDAIRILVTGGTFDKEYNELTGQLFFQQTHLADMLRLGRCRLPMAIETLFTMTHRSLAVAAQNEAPYRAATTRERCLLYETVY